MAKTAGNRFVWRASTRAYSLTSAP